SRCSATWSSGAASTAAPPTPSAAPSSTCGSPRSSTFPIPSSPRCSRSTSSPTATSAPERHRVRRHRRPRRAAELHRKAEEGKLVLLLGGDLLRVDHLDDLRPGRREHVRVHRQEDVRLL